MKFSDELLKRIRDGRIKIEMGGHEEMGVPFELLAPVGLTTVSSNREGLCVDAWSREETIEEWIELNTNTASRCSKCGRSLRFFLHENTICVDDCWYPDGYPKISLRLNCPSGRIIFFAADPRDIGIPESKNVDKSGTDYEHEAKIAEKNGIIPVVLPLVFSGRCDIYMDSRHKNEFAIGYPSKRRKTVGEKKLPRHENLRSSRQDHFACDVDHYKNKFCPAGSMVQSIEVDPGLYCIDYDTDSVCTTPTENCGETAVLYWKKIGDPVSDLDLYDMHDKSSYTASQVIWSLVTGNFREQAAADMLLCSNPGNHRRATIHPNGWVGFAEPIFSSFSIKEIPLFDKKYKWGEINRRSTISTICDIGIDRTRRVNQSFADLCFNVLRSMLIYGFDAETEAMAEWKTRWAWHAYRGLCSQYQRPQWCYGIKKPDINNIDRIPEI